MKNIKNRIPSYLLLFLFVFIIIELFFRIFFHIYFIKHPLPFKETDIKGVSYLMRNFSLDNYGIKHKPRIVILGDAISIHRSKDKKNYPELLDQKLSRSFEIINSGAIYYTLLEEMALLKNILLNKRPDIIIMAHVFNDLSFRNKHKVLIPLGLQKDIYRFKIITPEAIRFFRILYDNKYKYHHAYQFAPKIIDSCLKKYEDPATNSLLKASLDELALVQREKGIQIIFIIVPIFYDFNNGGINSINNFIYQECLRRNLICINLLEIFKINNYKVEEVKENDGDVWHQNDLGNEIIATEIYNQIINNSRFKNLINKCQGDQ